MPPRGPTHEGDFQIAKVNEIRAGEESEIWFLVQLYEGIREAPTWVALCSDPSYYWIKLVLQKSEWFSPYRTDIAIKRILAPFQHNHRQYALVFPRVWWRYTRPTENERSDLVLKIERNTMHCLHQPIQTAQTSPTVLSFLPAVVSSPVSWKCGWPRRHRWSTGNNWFSSLRYCQRRDRRHWSSRWRWLPSHFQRCRPAANCPWTWWGVRLGQQLAHYWERGSKGAYCEMARGRNMPGWLVEIIWGKLFAWFHHWEKVEVLCVSQLRTQHLTSPPSLTVLWSRLVISHFSSFPIPPSWICPDWDPSCFCVVHSVFPVSYGSNSHLAGMKGSILS